MRNPKKLHFTQKIGFAIFLILLTTFALYLSMQNETLAQQIGCAQLILSLLGWCIPLAKHKAIKWD